MIFFGQSESETCSGAWKNPVKPECAKIWCDLADTGKCHNSKSFWKLKSIFALGCQHPSVAIATCFVSAQIFAHSKSTDVVERRIARNSASRHACGQHVVLFKSDVFVIGQFVRLIFEPSANGLSINSD